MGVHISKYLEDGLEVYIREIHSSCSLWWAVEWEQRWELKAENNNSMK